MVSTDAPVAKVAALLEGYGLRRVPVVAGGAGSRHRQSIATPLVVENGRGAEVLVFDLTGD